MFSFIEDIVNVLFSVDLPININQFVNIAYRNDSGRPICFESLIYSWDKQYNGIKSYVFKVGGYIIVDNMELYEEINSNSVLSKLINDNKIVECDIEDAINYLEKQKRK